MPVSAYHLEPDAKGNLTINGKHFNLNIIGVEKGKKVTMTGSQRHTIFVALGSKDSPVLTRIYLSPGPDFRVCDGNGFDAPYDCNGVQVVKSVNYGATFQLPCNTHIQDDVSGSDGTFVSCDEPGANQAAYEVFVRELGKPMAPGAQTSMKTCAVDYGLDDNVGGGDDVKVCSTESVVLIRTTGKPSWDNVTQELTSLKADVNLDGHIDR